MAAGAFALISGGAPPAAGQVEAPAARAGATTQPSQDVSELLAETLAKHNLPAMAAATVEADGAIIALGAAGVRARGNDALATIDDLWHIGSCTKSMTASLCALLVEEGLLRWDSTLGEVFPEQAPAMHEMYRAITLEQLLSHRAGLPAGTGRRGLWASLWSQDGTPTDARRRVLAGVMSEAPSFPPGQRHEYSNYGYMLAGLMCEQVTQQPFESLLLERLLAPLEITTAGWGAPGSADVVDQPRGHKLRRPVRPGAAADNPPAMSPAGRLHLSMRDWARYIAWHLRGAAGEAQLLAPESFERLAAPAEGFDYALGWSVPHRDWAGGRVLAHNGSNTMWYCVVWAAPEKGFAVLVATNEGGDAAAKACDEVAGALIRLRQQPEPAAAPAGM